MSNEVPRSTADAAETTASSSRRSFLKNTMVAGVATVGAGILANGLPATADDRRGSLTKGDAALLRFAAAAEIIESDLWLQYQELAGTQDNEVSGPGKVGNPAYTAALTILDGDMPQYIHDNTEDEMTHFT